MTIQSVFRSTDLEVLKAHQDWDADYEKWREAVIAYSKEVTGSDDVLINRFLGSTTLAGFPFPKDATEPPAGWRALPRNGRCIIPIRNHKRDPKVIAKWAELRLAPVWRLPGMPYELHLSGPTGTGRSTSHTPGCRLTTVGSRLTLIDYVEVQWGVPASAVAVDGKFDAGKWEEIKLSDWYAEQGL